MNATQKLKLNMPTEADDITPEDANANMLKIEEYVTALTQMCTAESPAALTLSTSHKTLSFGSLTKSGYVFSLSGGGVKVLESGFAVVDMHVLLHSMAPGDVCTADICKNGATFYQCELSAAEYGAGATVDQTSKLIPIAKNDIFTVKVRNDTSARGAVNAEASYMNVRFLKNLNF